MAQSSESALERGLKAQFVWFASNTDLKDGLETLQLAPTGPGLKICILPSHHWDHNTQLHPFQLIPPLSVAHDGRSLCALLL